MPGTRQLWASCRHGNQKSAELQLPAVMSRKPGSLFNTMWPLLLRMALDRLLVAPGGGDWLRVPSRQSLQGVSVHTAGSDDSQAIFSFWYTIRDRLKIYGAFQHAPAFIFHFRGSLSLLCILVFLCNQSQAHLSVSIFIAKCKQWKLPQNDFLPSALILVLSPERQFMESKSFAQVLLELK